MKTLVLEKKALKHNIAVVREKAGPATIYGVLTGDGGGAGTVELAQLLREEGIGRFAVSELADAQALRKAGLVDEEILMLRSTTDREELDRLIDLDVVCTISSVDTALALDAAAKERSTVAEAHIQVDTGLGFGGFLAEEPEKIVQVYRNLTNVAVSGIFTQIRSVHADGRDAATELRAFEGALQAVRDAGFETGTVHAAGSYALLHYEFARMDAVRAGSVVLGRCRRRRGDDLVRVGYGEAQLQETRWLPKGHTIGGGESLVRLRRPTRVAILPVGYQNGFGVSRLRETGLLATLRRWWRSHHLTVRVAGQKAPVLGGIGAVETLLDVTDLKCSPGDLVHFDIDPLYAKGMTREYR
ncbi:alanine racemase [Flavonifractor sp. An92]|uniref:alanine racemase n=1 Tax=Flavonifractor sp. An92 TaxID=1965666 RepID=UPI000B385DB2|nr:MULTISPECIES: alanine racemase [unclassified Flavonifractor]OUN04192.1 alanine racemase [Flavonifractor sp. An92]OUQ21619.1 alanine racemase [Flavonifractor sp. An135]